MFLCLLEYPIGICFAELGCFNRKVVSCLSQIEACIIVGGWLSTPVKMLKRFVSCSRVNFATTVGFNEQASPAGEFSINASRNNISFYFKW